MTQSGDATDLQFDRAEFGEQAAALTCGACQQPIVDRYFDVNGQTTCATCHERIAAAVGSHPGPVAPLLALIGGAAGGFVGALLYFFVLKLTGYELGLIAIVVGVLVGRGVRWGSGGRGGRLYQLMAVAITYLAIVSTYMPFMLDALSHPPAPETAQTQTSQTDSVEKQGASASPASTAPVATQEQAPADAGVLPPLWYVVGALFVLMVISPFLGGFANIMGWVIIGIALWEAWKSNRRLAVAVSGPFTIAAAAAGAAAPATLATSTES